jgi:hypothetical protein
MVHELKSDPQSFIDVLRGEKLAEIRLDDREYDSHDFIHLRQTQYTGEQMAEDNDAPACLIYTGRELLLEITHIHRWKGMEEGYVALSFKVLK